MQDQANMLSTPPTRRNRFMLGNGNANLITDDSPVLSQETIHISWKWNNDSTPNRPTNKTSKLKRPLTSLQRLRENSSDNQTPSTATSGTSSTVAEPETHSPKGLYKFQEEMRKIQFDTESDTSCDNIYNDKSNTVSDTGYPTTSDGVAQADSNRNATFSDNLDDYTMNRNDETTKIVSQNEKHGIDDNVADDLFNDSDFDQILLTCKMPAQITDTCETKSESNKLSVKKASSAPEIKPSFSGSTGSGSGSNWNLVDDFDDLVKDIDFDVDISCTLNASAKFMRHKSMPQQPQKPNTSTAKPLKPQPSTYVDLNRKSFTRHESMPITNRSINTPTNNNNISAKQNSGKCAQKFLFSALQLICVSDLFLW